MKIYQSSHEGARELNKILRKSNEHEMKGEYEKAIGEVEKAIKINPKDGNLYNRLGDLCIKGKKVEKAIDIYKKGIEIFENEYYHRNALALCKKVLRYDPKNIEILPAMGNLLVELGDKSDAINCYFDYINKLKEQENTNEVLKTLKYIQTLDMKNREILDRMVKTYRELGRENLASELLHRAGIKTESEKPKTKDKAKAKEKPKAKEKSKVKEKSRSKDKELEESLANEVDLALQKAIDSVKNGKPAAMAVDTTAQVNKAQAELQKSIRFDELIKTLETSLKELSQKQKESIALLQKSLSLNLDTLQDSVERLQKGSAKNLITLEKLLKGLAEALSLLSKSQKTFTEQISNKIEAMGNNFSKATKDAVDDIKKLSQTYEKASDNICGSLNESKECNVSLLGISEELKNNVETMNQNLTDFLTTQEAKEKKRGMYFLILLGLVVAACILLAISIFK